MIENIESTTNWPDLAIGLYDRLTGRNAEITADLKSQKALRCAGSLMRWLRGTGVI